MLIEVGLKKEHDRGDVSDHRPDQQVADEVPKVSTEECVSRRGSSSDPSSEQVVQMRRETVQRKKQIILKQVRPPRLSEKEGAGSCAAVDLTTSEASTWCAGSQVQGRAPPDVLFGRSVHVEKWPLTMRHMAKAAAAAERAGVLISTLLKSRDD